MTTETTKARKWAEANSRLWLWLRIVGRENWSDRLTGPKLAWEIARIVWP